MNAGPDHFRNRLRFGCGGILGVGIGFVVSLRYLYLSSLYSLSICVLFCMLASGAFAVRFGDRYWEAIGKWFK